MGDLNATGRKQMRIDELLKLSEVLGEQVEKLLKDKALLGKVNEVLERKVEDLGKQVGDLKDQKDNAYAERNKVVSALARTLLDHGEIVGRRPDPENPGWHLVFCDFGPGTQLSWHFSDAELPLFEMLPAFERPYDGHTTEQKYYRLLKVWC